MTSWQLLVATFVVWLLWAATAATGRALRDRAGTVPERRRSPVTIVPVLVFPLVFWQVAKLVDAVAAPWGTLVVGCLHLFLGIVFAVGFVTNLQRLRTPPAGPGA